MANLEGSGPGPSTRIDTADDVKIWNCVACRRRKLKCDRGDQCNNCIKNNLECYYPITGRLPRRSRAPPEWNSTHERQEALRQKLSRLESVVMELSAQVEEGKVLHSAAVAKRDIPAEDGADVIEDFGSLLVKNNGTMRVDKKFWSVFCNEVDGIFQAIHDAAPTVLDGQDGNSNLRQSTIGQPNVRPLHNGFDNNHEPFPEIAGNHIVFLWQTFMHSVDPFVKVLSKADMAKVCESKQFHTTQEGKTLILAISLASVLSLPPNHTWFRLHIDRATMVRLLLVEIDQSLIRADFLASRKLELLQALCIYASVIGKTEARGRIPSIVAILIQQAADESAIDTTDGATASTEHLVELKARLRWQIRFLASEHLGESYRTLWLHDIKMPLIYPKMDGADETDEPIVLTARCSFWKLGTTFAGAGNGGSSLDLEALGHLRLNVIISDAPKMGEFSSFVDVMHRFALAKLEQSIYMTTKSRCMSTQDVKGFEAARTNLFLTTLLVFETALELYTNPDWECWRWQLRGQFPWNVIEELSVHLKCEDWTAASERAWLLLRKVTAALPESIHANGQLWTPIQELMEHAEDARVEAMAKMAASPIAESDLWRMIEEGNGTFYSEATGCQYPPLSSLYN